MSNTSTAYIDIDHTRRYLKKAGVIFNVSDNLYVSGDLTTLEGHVEGYGGRFKTEFRIVLKSNGVFVEYTDHYGDSFIKKVEQ